MYYFDPHIHMVSRTTDDYEELTRMGFVLGRIRPRQRRQFPRLFSPADRR